MILFTSAFFRCNMILAAFFAIVFVNSLRSQTKYERSDSSVAVFLPAGSVNVQVCSEHTIQIIHSPTRQNIPPKSLSVNVKWDKTPFEVKQNNNDLNISTKKVVVKINLNTGAISITDPASNLLFEENQFMPAQFKPEVILGEKTFNAQLNIHLAKNEGVYGLGQYQNGIMNYRGHDVVLTQENTQVAIPFLISTKLYGLMFDNYSKIRFHDNEDTTYFWFEVADEIDYYFIAGSGMDDVIRGYRKATGQAPMYSRWAYGYFQSKERYTNQEEILKTVKEFRDRKIPLDCIVQDWQYWSEDNAYWNAMRFDSIRYPDPKIMIDDLHEILHTHLMVSIWPVPGQKTDLYRELDSKGLLYTPYHWTDGRTYDAYSPEARRLYWNAINKGLFSLGVDAFWMDATEPEIVLSPTERSTKEARRNAIGTMARYLNPYSLLTTEAVYNGQRSVTSDKRVYILTRSAFLGQQRNAATTWSGDIVADWSVFRNQISAGLNYCMSGLPYWTNDIGGFHIRRYGGFPNGVNDPGYRELYVRWFQFGAFNPIFRSHGTDSPREPWQFSGQGSWAYNIILKYDCLRYRFMPYIYSLGWKVTSDGYTIMRGLPMDFPKDTNTYKIDDQFMFGPALMVSPVTKHMYYGESYTNELIPPDRLRTPEGKPGGYRAQYFNGSNLDTLMVDSVQTEMLFDMYLGRDMPPNVNWERNSIRWTGSFRTRGEGEYEFWITTDDALRFYLDGKEFINQWNESGKDTTFHLIIPMKADHWHNFKIEYARKANATKLRFAWRTPEMTLPRYNPIDETGSRQVYLPYVSGGWYDFWTGEQVISKKGRTINRSVPIDIIPLYVKAGSIIPLGPEEQYTTEKPTDPIELRIYTGADAAFELYNDEGDNYNYEHGAYSIIPFFWNEKLQTLTIGNRKGRFSGMPSKLSLKIIWVSKNHGKGGEITPDPDKTITYSGNKLTIKRYD